MFLSQILHKKRDEKYKLPFFLLFMVFGASLNGKKDNSSRTGFRIRILGVKKHQIHTTRKNHCGQYFINAAFIICGPNPGL
jgi:hypothetical protein